MQRDIDGGTRHAQQFADRVFEHLNEGSQDEHGYHDYGQLFTDYAVVLQRLGESIHSSVGIFPWYGRLLAVWGEADVGDPTSDTVKEIDGRLFNKATSAGAAVILAVDELLHLARYAREVTAEFDEAGKELYDTNPRYAEHRAVKFRAAGGVGGG